MASSKLSPEVLTRLACPVCHGALSAGAQHIACRACGRMYPIEDEIPVLLAERAHLPTA